MNFLDFFNQQQIFGIFLKLFGVVVTLLYLFFSIVIVRQVKVMRKLITFEDRGVLELGAYTQIVLAAILVVYALIIL